MKREVSDRRLLKLATFLRELPRDRFDYTKWVGDDWEGKPDLSCGTVACALGWATTIPEFRKLGLKLSLNHGFPVFGSLKAPFTAGAAFFGIELGDSFQLFSPGENGWNATPKQVARKIERFVKRRAKAESRT